VGVSIHAAGDTGIVSACVIVPPSIKVVIVDPGTHSVIEFVKAQVNELVRVTPLEPATAIIIVLVEAGVVSIAWDDGSPRH
jgi:hypothetical protein